MRWEFNVGDIVYYNNRKCRVVKQDCVDGYHGWEETYELVDVETGKFYSDVDAIRVYSPQYYILSKYYIKPEDLIKNGTKGTVFEDNEKLNDLIQKYNEIIFEMKKTISEEQTKIKNELEQNHI